MKQKIWKSILTIFLIITLSLVDFIILGHNIAIAIAEGIEEQGISTNLKNVEFDAYFNNNEEKVHEKQVQISSEEILIFNVNVKEKGSLNDAKIKINNPNFKILAEKVENNTYIKNVDAQKNEIELNSIIYQNSVIIKIPVIMDKLDSFAEDYFNKETTIELSGNYVDETEKTVSGQRTIKLNWSENIDINAGEEISKYIDLTESEVLIQQNIYTEVPNNILPREKEEILVKTQKVQDVYPTKVVVLLNGTKLEEGKVNYSETTGELEIVNEKIVDSEGKVKWGSAANEYNVIYTYNVNNKEEINTFNLNTTIRTKLYTRDEIIEKHEEKNIELNKGGNIVDLKKKATKEIYKGYMYANSDNETIFNEINTLKISDISTINTIELTDIKDTFKNNEGKEFDVSNNIVYKSTIFNKNVLNKILGDTYSIQITDLNDANIFTIDNNTVADESGNIQLDYPENVTSVKFITSKPQSEGNLSIRNIRAIKRKTGLAKEKLKSFNNLMIETLVEDGIGEATAYAEVNLKDTKTEIKTEINNTNLSTLQTNQNVQLLITLKSDSAEYDLFKNPVVDIILPKDINMDIKNIEQLNFNNEIKIVDAGMKDNDDGTKTIRITLEGEQRTFANSANGGIQIAIMGDINISNNVPSKSVNIEVLCQNENRAEDIASSQTIINIVSKYGVLMTNKLENYNDSNDIVEAIDDKMVVAQLNNSSEEKTATQTLNVINNYELPISEVSIIGRIKEETLNNENVKKELNIKLQNIAASQNKQYKMYYSNNVDLSVDSKEWKEDIKEISEVRAFKLELNEEIQPEEVFSVSENLNILNNDSKNEKSYINTTLDYKYLGSSETVNSSIQLNRSSQGAIVDETVNPEGITQEINGISTNILALSGGRYLTNEDTVIEGQGIRYIINLKNNTNQDITNVVLEATNTNAIYYNLIKYQEDVYGTMCEKSKIEEDETLTSKTMNIDVIKPGETAEVCYQISVKDVQDDNQKLTGQIKISADNYAEQSISNIENNISQGKLKLKMRYGFSEHIVTHTGEGYPISMFVKNTSAETLNNVMIELPVDEGLTFTTENLGVTEESRYEFIENTDNIVKFKIPEMNPGEEIELTTQLIVNNMPIDQLQKEISQYFTATYNDVKYISNDIYRTIEQASTEIAAIQTTNINKTVVKDGDNIKFYIEFENKGKVEKELMITDNIQDGLKINSAKLEKNTEVTDLEVIDENMVTTTVTLGEGEKGKIIIDTTLQADLVTGNKVMNYSEITGNRVNVKTNVVEFTIDGKEEYNPSEDSKIYSISGVAWVDSNSNGLREDAEPKLADIPIILIDETTGKIALDADGNQVSTITNSDGTYYLGALKAGEYTVVFKYNPSKYTVTTYQQEGVSDNTNSDVIYSTINLDNSKLKVAKTKTLELKSTDLENIDAGFIEGKIFDLRLDKYINKIIVQNSSGTRVLSYAKEKLAKAEIDSKYLANSNIIIEYGIDVTNEGEIGGYANEIMDYLPSDLDFSSEINKSWYQTTEGNVCTKELSNQIINPGETKSVTLTLTKTMTQDNTGTIINKSEINAHNNESMLEDIDSTPGNKNESEDDMSRADVIISVRTGGVIGYMFLIIIIVAIVGTGVFFINKEVLGKDI